MSWEKEIQGIETRRALAKEMGGEAGIARQRSKGVSTIRERIDGLLDENTFREHGEGAGEPEYDDDGNLTSFTAPNYVVGIGQVGGRRVVVGGEDFSLRGGSPNPSGLRKSVYVEDIALKFKLPLIRFHEGGGGSVAGPSGNRSRGPVGDPALSRPRFLSIARTLETVPVVTCGIGPVAGLPAARLCASHFSVIVEPTTQVLIGGPAVVERAIGEKLTKEELGGPQIHLRNGVVNNGAKTEADAFSQMQQFLSYLPANIWEVPPEGPRDDDANRTEEALLDIVPRDRRKPFNMRQALNLILDNGSFFEISRRYGRGQIVGLARIDGQPVGILANDSHFYAGSMDADGAQKVRRFVEMCDQFHLPIVSFVDEPGFMIGSASEKSGTIRYGAETIVAVMRTRVPWVSIMVRKSYGVAAIAHFGPYGTVFSWPSVEQGPLPIEGGVAVAYRREIAAADDPDAKRRELEERLVAGQSPFPRAEGFSVQELLDPRETRPALCEWIALVKPNLKLLVPNSNANPWPV
ncbi:MAG: acetyl-CoA carboxylase carboxyltransferase component [Gammaproteobacteria bacterium]|jgi:acetyl-CoA carboxylase carboxyltransferase component